MLEVPIVRLDPDLAAPAYAREGDAGADAGDEGGPAVAAVASVLSGFRGVFVFDGQAAEEL